MGVIRKQSTYSSLVIYAGILIGFLGTSVIRPKILSAEEIGFLQVVMNMISLFGAAAILGSHLIVVKMYPKFKTQDHKNRGLFRLVMLITAVGLLICLPLFFVLEPFFFENNQHYRFQGIGYDFWFYALLLVSIASKAFFYVFDNFLRMHHQSVQGVFSENIVLKALPILALGLIYFGAINFAELVYFNLLIFIIPVLIGWYYLHKVKAINWAKPGPYSNEEKREMRGIAQVGFVELISFFIVLFIDVFMLKRLMNDEAVGIYTTMFYFGAVVSVPMKALIRIAQPVISDAFAVGDFQKIQSIYQKSGNVLFLLGTFVFLVVWSNRFSIENFLGPVYSQGIWVIFFIGLAQLVEVLSSLNYQIIAITPHYRFNLIMGLATVFLLIATNYIFIHFYGLIGVAVGSLVSMIVVNLARHIFLLNKYGLNPFSASTVKILLLGFAVFSVSEMLPNVDHIIVNVIYKSASIAMLFLPAAYWLKCSDDFNEVVDKYLRKLSLLK